MSTVTRTAFSLCANLLGLSLTLGGASLAHAQETEIAACDPAVETAYSAMNQTILDETKAESALIIDFNESNPDEAAKAALLERIRESAKRVKDALKTFRDAHPQDLECRLATQKEVLKIRDLDQSIVDVENFESTLN